MKQVGDRRMTVASLMLRSLWFHRYANLAVLLGSMVGASVLTGALLVGDSMRGSLRGFTLERLGQIDQAAVSSHFFNADLSDRVNQRLLPRKQAEFEPTGIVPDTAEPRAEEAFRHATCCILVRGSIRTRHGAIAKRVQIVGASADFWRLFPSSAPHAQQFAGQCIANMELAAELNVAAGHEVILALESASTIPREGLLGERDSEKALRRVPLTIDRLISTQEAGRFSLDANQRLPKTLFVPLDRLAEAIGQPGRGNAILLTAADDPFRERVDLGDALLGSQMRLDDFGLRLIVNERLGYVSVESRSQILSPRLAEVVEQAARDRNNERAILRVFTYLANSITAAARSVPYSIVSAIDQDAGTPLGALPTTPAGARLGANQVFINQWTADRLAVKPGDRVRMEYYRVESNGALQTAEQIFTVAGIVRMEGLGLDRGFTPEFPGITNARTFANWDPPFPIDLKRIRKPDEDYWRDYRTTPKAFVRLDDGQRLWSTRFGNLTSVRFPIDASMQTDAIKATAGEALLARLSPGDVGISCVAVKTDGLAASAGSSDFGMLFAAFSGFLMASSALLLSLLFRLNVERRSKEYGVLSAIGLRGRTVGLLMLLEGLLIVAIGSALGSLSAVGYARLMLAALTTWWQEAVKTPFIEFHWTVATMLQGALSALLIAALAIAWTTIRLGTRPASHLLTGAFVSDRQTRGAWARRGKIIAAAGASTAVTVMALAVKIGETASFFASAVLLLLSGISIFSVSLHGAAAPTRPLAGSLGVVRLGVRNGSRHAARSVLTVALVALAWFLIAAIGLMRHGTHDTMPDTRSGNGGFSLIGQTDVPLFADLNLPKDRAGVGITTALDSSLESCNVFGFRVRPGDDASCLNIYQPKNPTLLGAGEKFVKRGGFRFGRLLAATDVEKENPWRLLEREFRDGAIPAIGDANALQWILKVGVGEDMVIRNEHGQPLRLRIVAALVGSIFQGELVVAERDFLRHFPSRAGHELLLAETPESWDTDQLTNLGVALENELSDFGFDAVTTAQRLAEFRSIENTYMAAFQSLGGLGLVLGTLGLGTVLLRNVIERRGELALLRALGFRKAALGVLVQSESLFLLICGLVLGSACAAVAVYPALHHATGPTPIGSLLAMLALVLVAGLASGFVATLLALRTPLLTALRRE